MALRSGASWRNLYRAPLLPLSLATGCPSPLPLSPSREPMGRGVHAPLHVYAKSCKRAATARRAGSSVVQSGHVVRCRRHGMKATTKHSRGGLAGACVAAVLAAVSVTSHAGGLDEFIGVWDAPGRYFPGHYFEQKAQFYLAKKDYAEALRLFELSAYWSDKVSQYNVAIMYYN